MSKPYHMIAIIIVALPLALVSCSGDEGHDLTGIRGGSGGQSMGEGTGGGAGSASSSFMGGSLRMGDSATTTGTDGKVNLGGIVTTDSSVDVGGGSVLDSLTSSGDTTASGNATTTGGITASGGSMRVGGTTATGGSTGGNAGMDAGGSSPNLDGHGGTGGTGTSFNPCPTSGDCRILPLGDSITDGYHGVSGAYRVPLFKKAIANNKHITFVGSLANGPAAVDGVAFPPQHEGHVGSSLLAIVAEAPAPSANTSPHIVLMMGGTNDVRYASGAAAAPKNANQVLETLFKKYPDALIVMAQIPPMSNSAWNAAAIAFNATLPNTVNQHIKVGKHVNLVDMHTGFPTSGLADGVHPNATGCEHIANVWYQAISSYLH